MGQRGPAPLPTKTKRMRGNPGKRPLNDDEPELVAKAPRCPAHLTGEARAEWRRVARTLNAAGLLTQVDRGAVAGDDRADWRQAWALFPGDVAYVWHGSLHGGTVLRSLEACGFAARSQIVGVKVRPVISRGHYHWQHEVCWYVVREGAKANWIGDRKQSTVWEWVGDETADGGHSTQKPVEMMAKGMRNHKGDVFDPFMGSGTTLMAAELEGRRCWGVEIEVGYVGVVLQRYWEGLGIKGEVISNG